MNMWTLAKTEVAGKDDVAVIGVVNGESDGEKDDGLGDATKGGSVNDTVNGEPVNDGPVGGEANGCYRI
jgi:hypothetical protein